MDDHSEECLGTSPPFGKLSGIDASCGVSTDIILPCWDPVETGVSDEERSTEAWVLPLKNTQALVLFVGNNRTQVIFVWA